MLGVGLLAAATVTCLPASPPAAALPTWSPAGDQIAYTVPAEESAAIAVTRPAGIPFGSRVSFDSAPVQLEWAPRGSTIAFEKRTGAIETMSFGQFGANRELVHAEFGTTTELGDWSPDARFLVFARDGHIHTLDTVTGDIRYLVDGLHPTWSPDGLEIAYAVGNEIFGIGPAGGTPRVIAVADLPVTAIAWSPDSTRLAFLGAVLGVVSRFGGKPVYLTQAFAPLAWRANGIFYTAEAVAPVRDSVYRIDPDTDKRVQLTHLPAADDAHFAAASRDGLRVAYELDAGYVHAGVRLIDGGRDEPLVACHGTSRPDTVRGSRLNDVIRINSGGRDRVVSCGRGTDVVYADRRDRVARDCETVTRLP